MSLSLLTLTYSRNINCFDDCESILAFTAVTVYWPHTLWDCMPSMCSLTVLYWSLDDVWRTRSKESLVAVWKSTVWSKKDHIKKKFVLRTTLLDTTLTLSSIWFILNIGVLKLVQGLDFGDATAAYWRSRHGLFFGDFRIRMYNSVCLFTIYQIHNIMWHMFLCLFWQQ